MMAAHAIVHEGADVAIGAGVETITMMQDGTQNTSRLANKTARERFPGLYFPMGVTAEIVAERYGISREDQDAYALQSQQRYATAVEKGYVAEEIAPMKVTPQGHEEGRGALRGGRDRRPRRVQPARRPPSMVSSALPPVFKKAEEGGTVTAGNASQLSDGASATLLMSAERAKQLGVEPLGIYRGTAVAGCGPEEMGIGPVFAVPKLLKRHGLTIDDIDIVELNEAFASQLLYCQRQLGIPNEKLNPSGGSISIGHPFGMTGSRMTGLLLRQLRRRGQALRHRHHVHRRRPGAGFALRGRLASLTRRRSFPSVGSRASFSRAPRRRAPGGALGRAGPVAAGRSLPGF